MKTSCDFIAIFDKAIEDYHILDTVDQGIKNPYKEGTLEHILYLKNWVDTVQWHYEDLIRDPEINPQKGMYLKRLIDASNQKRTDLVEKLDDFFIEAFKGIQPDKNAKLNTESLGWVVDRMSILCLKIYHMQEQIHREDISANQRRNCVSKRDILLEQKTDLIQSFEELVADIQSGVKQIKVYRQMKMYNDENLNPVLYSKQKK